MPSTINAKSDPYLGQLIKASDGTANLALQTNSTNALSIDTLQNPTCNSTGSIKIPSGTTAQRPSPAVNGMVRYNTDAGNVLEGYINGAWASITGLYTYSASYLIVAGGGGSAAYSGGGGGGDTPYSETAVSYTHQKMKTNFPRCRSLRSTYH